MGSSVVSQCNDVTQPSFPCRREISGDFEPVLDRGREVPAWEQNSTPIQS